VSGVIRPAGPLPARVYWVRRALLVIVLALVLSLGWWAIGRIVGGSGSDASASSGTSGTGDSGGGATAGGASGHGQRGDQQSGRHRRDNHKPKHHRPVAPSGDCAPAQVDIDVQVHDAASGHVAPIGLKLTSVGTPACTLAITPDTLALRITSGSDVVWSSVECPNAVLARELVVRAHKPVVYTFDWDGRRSTETCAQPGKVAAPGGYWAEAALIGADVHRGYFDVT
jgi:hypothetical protein